MDKEVFKNCRPVSNLPFISTVVEKGVASRLYSHITMNDLHDWSQWAYRKFHSTETALLKVSNDILSALDKGSAVILVMLDLSSAFNTIDHGTMVQRLDTDFSINGKALDWFRSYLEDRYHIVCIEGQRSTPSRLTCFVHQGSVFSSKEFTLYTKPIGGIIREYGLKYHLYADDSQNYFVCEALDNAEVEWCLDVWRNVWHAQLAGG